MEAAYVGEGQLASGRRPAAREVLEKAFVANPKRRQIWLAPVKLDAENGESDVAREPLVLRAHSVADLKTQRVSLRGGYLD